MSQITLPPITLPEKEQARLLYFMGYSLTDIAKQVGKGVSTVHGWKEDNKWDDYEFFNVLEYSVNARLIHLIMKEKKSNGDFKEISHLAKTFKPLIMPSENERTRTTSLSKIDPIEFAEKIEEWWQETAFPYQREAIENIDKGLAKSHSNKMAQVLKSRQIGMTWGLANGRTLRRAANLGHDQIYISASQRQSFQARDYIKKTIKEIFGVDVQGTESITLPNGATIHFLPSNPATAQGYSGDVTIDEYAWMQNFDLLTSVVRACATLKQYNIVMSSTPSDKSHPSYNAWSGITDKNRKGIVLKNELLSKGYIAKDHTFRMTITVEDAVNGGNDMLDIEQLKNLNQELFGLFYMCEWGSNERSVFNSSAIIRNFAAPYIEWLDYNEGFERPFGNGRVIIGYDPARVYDASAVVVIALPNEDYPYYRVLEKYDLFGDRYEEQAEMIKGLTERFNVVSIGIDATAVGATVAPMVEDFFDNVTANPGSATEKYRLVAQAQRLFREDRLKFSSDWIDVYQCFMSVRTTTTRAGNVVYESTRSATTAHADYAWAIMYAIGSYEDIAGKTKDEVTITGGFI